MPRSKNYAQIQGIKKSVKENLREDLLNWIAENSINAGDRMNPWSVVELEPLKAKIEELTETEKEGKE